MIWLPIRPDGIERQLIEVEKWLGERRGCFLPGPLRRLVDLDCFDIVSQQEDTVYM